MADFTPTEEQQAVINHDHGHARVLAVAGSGKTATMVHRIEHLVRNRGVDPKKIRALMFNKLAKDQFADKLQSVLGGVDLPFVSTFHGFAYNLIEFAKKRGLIEPLNLWTGGEEERSRILVHKCIRELEKAEDIPPDEVDIDDALEAIGLWKGALIQPKNAGHYWNDYIPTVYALFEEKRRQAKALTFDDFVPVAVRLLEQSETISSSWCNRYDHLIVDEYQDVNYGQQRLIEVLAGDKAEIMVVGDDDQTIYEWRGARPTYIIRDFQNQFANKPHTKYILSRTFRFGPLAAQVAQNAISHNSNRVEKEVVSFFHKKKTGVSVRCDSSSAVDINNSLADEIQTLLARGVQASEIWALGRMFAQLSGLQMSCLSKRIPFRVMGGKPFFQRTEIQRLLQYLEISQHLHDRIAGDWRRNFIEILNVPSRKIRREWVSRALTEAQNRGMTGIQFLDAAISTGEEIYHNERNSLKELRSGLNKMSSMISNGLRAEEVLEFIIDEIDYEAHFRDYYGQGEASVERIATIRSFIDFTKNLGLAAGKIKDVIDSFDITQGSEPEDQITFTTIYRTKGLEFDHVYVPDCVEGFLPCLFASDNPAFDTSGEVKEADPSLAIEGERRLFYVALTRARKSVNFGHPKAPNGIEENSDSRVASRFIEEMQLGITEEMLAPIIGGELTDDQRQSWTAVVKSNAGYKGISRNLSHYLGKTKATSDATWVGALAEKVDVAKFEYSRAYQKVGKLREKVSKIAPSEFEKELLKGLL